MTDSSPTGPPSPPTMGAEFPPPDPSSRNDALSVAPLRARHVYLRPITPDDYSFLRMLEMVGDLAPRWRHRGVTPSPDQWVHTLWADVLTQFIVVGVDSQKPVGRVLVYHPNFQDRHAYFAALRFDRNDRSPLMMLGISLFLRYVFTSWDFDKLYMEVPEYNYEQFASGLGRFFEIEGRLRNHFRTGVRTWDQLILAMYREQASLHSGSVRLDFGARSEFAREVDTSVPSWSAISWEMFVREVAAIADVPEADIHAESRVLEDLALDSLSLAELGVVLVDRYDVYSLSKDLETRRWDNVTVRGLYDEYLSGAPTRTPPPELREAGA